MTGKARARPPLGWLILAAITIVLLIATLWSIFFYAPVEATMGLSQKIFYFHVPSAYAMYVGFGICALASGFYLYKRREVWDAVAVAGAEAGLLFCAIVLISGPLWARNTWGVYWKWDPRLTTTLLAAMIFLAYIVLRSFGSGEAERRFAAGLAIVAIPDLIIIHYSVKLWRGQHPTVITEEGQGIAPAMVPALVLGFVLFTALAAILIWTRARMERMRQQLRALELEAAERGLLEDG